jgi:hypothetical protein
MERHIDYLSFTAGGKMTVPFQAFLIFSSNLRPDQLGDEAFLRRIAYKMFLRSPKAPEFMQIFQRYAASRDLYCPPGLINRFVEKHYIAGGKKFRRVHPRDVISHAIDIIHFSRLPMELTEEVLDQAFHSCFIENVDVMTNVCGAGSGAASRFQRLLAFHSWTPPAPCVVMPTNHAEGYSFRAARDRLRHLHRRSGGRHHPL